MGASIAMLGALCVLLRMVVGLWSRTVTRSITDFLIKALKTPKLETLKGAPTKRMGKVRFQLKDEEDAGFHSKSK